MNKSKNTVWNKIFCFILFFLCAGQGTSAQTITFRGKDVKFTKVIEEIRRQTGYSVYSTSNILAATEPVTLVVVEMNLEDFLKRLVANQPIDYKIQSKNISFYMKEKPASRSSRPQAVFPQRQTIVGQVTHASTGQAIIGVSVTIKELGITATTTDNGVFTFPNTLASAPLTFLFRFIGMKPIEATWEPGSVLKVSMEDEVEMIKEAVVTGIYQRKKESFTGSSATYTAEELKTVGNQNVLQSLKTLDPSFQIMESSIFGSDPNRLPDIEINGKSSVIGLTEEYGTNPNQPLFILDGFETSLSVISDFSMDRIETITVLKDAAATAIYGSKAANGVVVVESKRPLPGELKIRYSLNGSVTFPDLSDYNLMNAQEKLDFERLTGYYGTFDNSSAGSGGRPDRELLYYDKLKDIKRGVDTYWLNEPLRTGIVNRHNLTAEGGDKNFRYLLSISHGNTQGVMRGSNRQLSNGNAKLIYRKGSLSFSNSLSIDYTVAEREPVSFSRFAQASPYRRKYNAQGGVDPIWENFFTSAGEQNNYNPLYDFRNNNRNRAVNNGFTNNFELLWDMRPGFVLRYRLGLNKDNLHQEIFRSPFNTEFLSVDPMLKGTYEETNGNALNYDTDLSLTLVKMLHERHLLNLVSGVRLDQKSSLATTYAARGFVDEEFTNPAFSFGYPESGNANYLESKRRSASFYLSTGYTYDQRFLFDGTLRSDGSSVYGASRKFTTIWSTGIGWNLHNEDILPFSKWGWLNIFKMRASIGNPGNQNFEDYISTRIYRYNQENRNPFGSSVILSSFGNPNLRWQKTLNKNIGIELQAFNRRLKLEGDYIHKTTDPLLVYVGMPSSTGSQSMAQNMGTQISKGFVVTSNALLFQRNELSWRINLSASHLTSVYDQLGSSLDNHNTSNKSRNLVRYYDGASPSDLWAVPSLGIDPITGREVFLNREGQQTFTHNYEDERVVGNSDPKITGVVGTSISYKGFSLSANLRYRLGGQIFMQTLYNKVENINTNNLFWNHDKRAYYDRWQKPGDVAQFKSIASAYGGPTPISSRFVQDNNQLIGESFTMGYEVNNKPWMKRAGLSSLMARAYMNDIFYSSTVKNERGLDYPFARSVSFSLSLGF